MKVTADTEGHLLNFPLSYGEKSSKVAFAFLAPFNQKAKDEKKGRNLSQNCIEESKKEKGVK